MKNAGRSIAAGVRLAAYCVTALLLYSFTAVLQLHFSHGIATANALLHIYRYCLLLLPG
ncbi:hypothetical protein [Caballeronia sp. NK8]|uniref:hypothetical protein n=1 Tax=Caballeronia sp. NK8 TaxID=140098 RepID=UPI001BCEE686|nr:hypothetical protein [Caballeronia sp. NK8]